MSGRISLSVFKIEGHFALGAKGNLLKSFLRYAVFGSTVEALHYEFIQQEPTPAADRPVFQSMPEYAVFLSASETTDNKVIFEHSNSGSCLLMDRFYTIHRFHIIAVKVWKSLWCRLFPIYHEGGHILQGAHCCLSRPMW